MTIPAASKQWIERCEVPASNESERSCFEAFQNEFDYLCRSLRRLGVRTEDPDPAYWRKRGRKAA